MPKDNLRKDRPAKAAWPKDKPAKAAWSKDKPAKAAWSKDKPAKESWSKDKPAKSAWSKDKPAKAAWSKDKPAKAAWSKDRPAKESWSKDKPAKSAWSKDKPAKAAWSKDKPAKSAWSKDKPAKAAWSKDKPAKSAWSKDKPAKSAWSKDKPAKAAWSKDKPAKAAWSKDRPVKTNAIKEPAAPIFTGEIAAGEKDDVNMIFGRQAILEAIKGGRSINKVLLVAGSESYYVKELEQLCRTAGIVCQRRPRSELDKICSGQNHQGVLAYAAPLAYAEVEDILAYAAQKGEAPFVLVLAEVSDPHNLGAVLRTAECAGVHGVIIPKHRSVPLTDTVVKVSAGAAQYVPVARVTNLNQTIEYLKAQGLWVAGADMQGGSDLWRSRLDGPVALVLGSEGSGIPELVAKNCDFMVRIPMLGKIASLNVSAGAAILMYEVLRQRLALKTN